MSQTNDFFLDKWLRNLSSFIRKNRLKIYKGKKIKESKTRETRMYFIKFHVHIEDGYNPQVSELQYEMVVPGKAAFFAKRNLKEAIQEKISVQIVNLEELSDEEYAKFKESEIKYKKSLEK